MLGSEALSVQTAYDHLVLGELDYAMSAIDLMPSPHALTIMMTAAGRFLTCEECRLSFKFPAGISYDMVARQFPCCFVNPPKDVTGQPETRHS